MILDTLVTEEEATEMLAHYEAQLVSERTLEDEAIMAGYRAAKRGLPVISLTNVFKAGGFHDDGRPKLAIVRADAKECWVHTEWSWNESLFFSDHSNTRPRGAFVGQHTVRVPLDNGRLSFRGAKTIVPTIPPHIRPNKRRLASRHILWEVEEWTPVPPKDPALLRHIRGDLWAVEAVWDLTELERAVLSQRRSS